jgi:hypothetical protein
LVEVVALFTVECGMLIGYARVSTIEQNVNLQIDKLKNIGRERNFHDKVSGANRTVGIAGSIRVFA